MNFVNNADPAEGVLFPQTGHAIHHSTYFAKQSPETAFVGTADEGSAGTPYEGVHTLAPIPQMTTANGPSVFAYPNQRTTFFTQKDGLAEPTYTMQTAEGIWMTEEAYAQVYGDGDKKDEKKAASSAGTEPEKVHSLEPIAY